MSCTGCTMRLAEFYKMIDDADKMMDFLQNHNLILKQKICPECGALCQMSKESDTEFQFRCTASSPGDEPEKKKQKVDCSFQESVRRNTFFDGTLLSLVEICSLIMWDPVRFDYDELRFVAEQLELSRPIVIDWKNYLREVYVDWCITHSRPTIGGPNKIIEITESKVGPRKYNCGRLVEGQWMYVGIEHKSRKLFIVPVEQRNPETLLAIIKERIADGTTIRSKCWKAYNCLDQEDYKQQAVNHSMKFKDPVRQKHTQNVDQKKEYSVGHLAKRHFQNTFKDHTEAIHEIFMAVGRLYDPSREAVINDVHFEEYSEDEEESPWNTPYPWSFERWSNRNKHK